jgi:DNA-binding CsgD family transcriptional regulator
VREEVRRACRNEPDPLAVQRAVAAALTDAVPFDRWCGLLLDPATLLTTTGYHADGLPEAVLPRLMEIEAADDDVNGLPALVRSAEGVSTIDRATASRPETSARYRDVLEPSGLGRELRAVMRDRDTGWGAVVLMRETKAPDFTDDEVAFVRSVTDDVARGIRRCLLRSELAHRDDDSVPGMVVVAAGGFDVALQTAAAARWLATVDSGVVAASLSMPVMAVVAKARTAADGVARTRLRSRDGRWLTLYAEATTPSADAEVAVVVEPTQPYELAAVLADAYLLSPREREVAQQVLLGRSTAEIAAALFLSAWTVQDHLKKVFDKVGVRSRAELASRLFFGDYLPRSTAGAPLGADGWFIGP